MFARTAKVMTLPLFLGALALAGAASAADTAPKGSGPLPLGSNLNDLSRMPNLWEGKWMTFEGFVEGDASLTPPYTPKAQAFVKAYKHMRDIPYAQEGCKSPGLPLAMRLGGGLKFTYAPGLISIYMQSVGHTRFIKMNSPMPVTTPKLYGTSVGRWEGDTLVVETNDFTSDVNFQYGVGTPLPPEETVGTVGLGPPPTKLLEALSAAIWGPPGEHMRHVERIRMIDADTIEIELTVYDDTVWTKPYVTKRQYKRSVTGRKIDAFGGGPQIDGDSDPEEFVCTISITSFDPVTNTYTDKDPEEMVKMLEGQ